MRNLKDIYNEKKNLEKRIFNMIKSFEKKNLLIVTGITFFDENNPNEEYIDNYTEVNLNVSLFDDYNKLELKELENNE
jgi:hypothetical protein